ncbi:hypothetical protein OQA88_10623 [Cercophora sp. LCS_1]
MSDTQPPPGAEPPPPPPPPPPSYGPPETLPHDNIKANLYAAGITCWAIAAVFVGIRFYTRGVIIRVLGWSDWFIFGALVFSAGDLVALVDQVVHGSGSHIWDLDPTDSASAIAWFRSAWYGILMYLLSLFCSKMSILCLYLHLFAFKWAHVATKILIALVILTNLFMLATTFTACIPLDHYWNIFAHTPDTYCHPNSFWWANTGMHMATDILIFLLPMPVVWGITLPRRQKLMLFGVFGIGFVVCFISILRLPKLDTNHKKTAEMMSGKIYDFTYEAAELMYLTSVEVNGAIVCACVMTLKPFIARFFPGVLGSLQGTGRSSSGRTRGPPTIGSLPSKPISPADTEVMGKIGGSVVSTGKSGWSGYVEIDEWGIDVELAEGVKKKGSASGSSLRVEDVIEKDR